MCTQKNASTRDRAGWQQAGRGKHRRQMGKQSRCLHGCGLRRRAIQIQVVQAIQFQVGFEVILTGWKIQV